jgi:imidazolonepropionase-like amidohydrolase/ABC-type polysaccharide/polyol phosphate export permease
MYLHSVVALVRAQLIAICRSKTTLFWITAFPVGFLLLFGFVVARGDRRVATALLPGLLATTLLSGALFGLALPLVQQRESGLLRRLRVTPLRASAVALAHALTALVIGFVSLVVLMWLARLLFGVQPAGSWGLLSIVYVCGACALLPVGLLVGSAARDIKTAPAIANLLFFPMMFLSGAAIPFALLPDAVKQFARLLPSTYLVDTYAAVIVRGESLGAIAASLAVLVAFGVVGVTLASMIFRWEGTEPIPRRALATILAALAITATAAAATAPTFRMNDLPGVRRIDPGEARGQVLVLRGATVLDGTGGRIVNARVVVRDHRVTDVILDDPRVALPEGAVVHDVRGLFLIPGLIDSHVHWGGSGGIGASPIEQTDDRLTHDLAATLAAGVTSVVSLTDRLADVKRLAADVASGQRIAPRTFFAGPSITARGGHPAEMFEFLPGLAEQLTRQVTTPDEARHAIAELDRAQVDLVKLVLEPGMEDRPLPRLSDDVFRAAMAEAKARRMKTTVHVGTDHDVRLAIEAGADGVEHAARGLTDDTISLMAARKVAFTPTNVVLDVEWKRRVLTGADDLLRRLTVPELIESVRRPDSPFTRLLTPDPIAIRLERALAGALDQTARALRAGVPVLAGSDAGNALTFHGVSLLRELELLARAGMPLPDVLKAATSRAADRLGQHAMGRVTTGAVADLVLLGGDPTASVHAYRDVRAVYLGGRRLDLDRLLAFPPRWSSVH